MSESESNTVVTQCADALASAERTRRPIEPLTDRFPQLTLREAYLIQQLNVSRRTQAGERIVGRKIGLTAKAMQDLFGVREPDYGHLLDTMMHDGAQPLDLGELIDPQVEVEPAFVLGKRLVGPNLSIEEVLDATDHIRVCLEIIDSRIIQWRIKLQDTVADNGSSARVVLGPKCVKPTGLALENLETTLEVDGLVVESGNTSAILGHPARGVAWLAMRIAEYGGALEAGDVVLPGTCTRSYRLAGHTRTRGTIAGLGDVSIEMKNAPHVKSAART